MEPKYIEYLKEFNVVEYFDKRRLDAVQSRYKFFQDFFQEKNLLELKKKLETVQQGKEQDWTKNEIWKVFIKMRSKINSFSIPAFSGKRALGDWPNHPLERYINVFYYLKYGDAPQKSRILKILNRDVDVHLRGFGLSSLSEIVAQAFPNEYVFYNKRNKEALRFLEIDLKLPENLSDGEEFLWYNEGLTELISNYQSIIYPHYGDLISKTTIHQEIDQFFNWIYETKMYSSDSAFIEPIGKISKILLNSYNTFKKKLVIDFTYPSGHERAGQPLEKICIIGQSGTGKTTLLNLIKHFTFLDNESNEITKVGHNSVEIEYRHKNIKLQVVADENSRLKCQTINSGNKNDLKDYNALPRLINFPANSVQNFKEYRNDKNISRLDNINLVGLIDFSEPDLAKRMWKKILSEIEKFKREELELKLQISKKLEQGLYNEIIRELQTEFNKNKDIDKENPLEKYANYVNPILEKFDLKVKTDIDIKTIDNLNFIELEHIKYSIKQFDNSKISWGAQQILEKTASLYSIAPFNTIILVDEPENALYPDVQKIFVEHLIKESWQEPDAGKEPEKTCQFFFATHSPTIASAFDPWEIFELKFDDDSGEVYVENYLKDQARGRHVDNYKFYPKYLRWDKIFTQIFDLDKDGDQERRNQLYKLAKIEEKIKYLKKKGADPGIINEEIENFKQLAEKLSWDYNNAML